MAQDEVSRRGRYRHTGKPECCPACFEMVQRSRYPNVREWLIDQLGYVLRGFCPWCGRPIFLGWLPEVMREHIKNHHGESVLEALREVGGLGGSA